MEVVLVIAGTVGLVAGIIVTCCGCCCPGVACCIYFGLPYRDGAERSGKRACAARGWLRTGLPVWRALRTCLRYRLEQVPPQGQRRRLYAAWPHGATASCAVLTFLAPAPELPDANVLLGVHSRLFWLPGVRDLLLALGAVDVSRATLDHLHKKLPRTCALALIVDGIYGMGPPIDPGRPRPTGFLRFVYEHREDMEVVPVFCRGERELCWVPPDWAWLRRLRCFFKDDTPLRLPFPTVFFPRFWRWPQLRPCMGKALVVQDKETQEEFFLRFWRDMDAL